MTSLTENLHPPSKIFFGVQTRRLASFDTSTRSVTLTGAEKFLCKATCVLVFFFLGNPQKQPDAKVLRSKELFLLSG